MLLGLPKQVSLFLLSLANHLHPAVAACGCWLNIVGTKGEHLYPYPVNPDYIKCLLLFCSSIAHPAAIIRNTVLHSVHYDTNYPYAHDYDLWIQLADTAQLANLPQVLLHYRQIQLFFFLLSCLEGWATWRRVWKNVFDYNLTLWPKVRDNNWLQDILGTFAVTIENQQPQAAIYHGSDTAEKWQHRFEADLYALKYK